MPRELAIQVHPRDVDVLGLPGDKGFLDDEPCGLQAKQGSSKSITRPEADVETVEWPCCWRY